MSIEHDNLPLNPRLETLLRQIVAANDLQPAQNQRVRARLGLHPHQAANVSTATLPASRQGSMPIPAVEQDVSPMITTSRGRLRQQWLQFALAAVAFIAVGVLLALVFGSGGDDPETQPGVGGSPEATATVAPATATIGSQDPSALPTPDETGTYRGITVEQARQIVQFEIVMPERVPEGLEPPELTVVELRRPVPPGARDYQVEMVYEVSGDESPPKSVTFTQLGPSFSDLNLAETESTTTTTINGVEVTRIAGRSTGGDPLLAYTWERDDLHYMIFTALDDDLTPELVENLMLAILVPPGPTAEEQSAILEQERVEMMSAPVPDWCEVSPWAGPDFRVRRSEAAAYFIDGDGLTLGTTHGVLFAGENEITWLADAPLTTEEALAGPRSIMAGRSDSRIFSDPVPVEIPIEEAQQIERGIIPDDVERGWWTTVSFPEEGCWEIEVTLGPHILMATVYVYPQPPSGEFPQIDGAVMVDAAQLDSTHLPFAASDAVGYIHVVEGEPNTVNSYYSVPTQALREAGWSGGGFLTLQYVSYSGWSNGDQIVLFTIIHGRAQEVFPDEIQGVDLGPFPDALDAVGDNESLIYTRTATCEEPTIEDCMQAAFAAVNEPAS